MDQTIAAKLQPRPNLVSRQPIPAEAVWGPTVSRRNEVGGLGIARLEAIFAETEQPEDRSSSAAEGPNADLRTEL